MPNLSKYYPIEVDAATVVYTTGNQTIQGTKNFTNRPQVNGINVLIQGEGGGGGSVTLPSEVVYTTGNQTIQGTKNFTIRPTVNGTNVLLQGEGGGGGGIITFDHFGKL